VTRPPGEAPVGEQRHVNVRLFGLRSPRMNRFEEEGFPFSPGLTVGQLWSELQRTAEPHTVLASLPRDAAHAFVNGVPIQRTDGWDTPVAADDIVTYMVMAAGGLPAWTQGVRKLPMPAQSELAKREGGDCSADSWTPSECSPFSMSHWNDRVRKTGNGKTDRRRQTR
jgi:molybdopterin converting factor small subunit